MQVSDFSREIVFFGTCIKLREDKPFREIMQEVIEDIRKISSAEFCCVLLLDEITSALDESNKQNVNEIIHGYATEKQVAVLWVTHDRNEISHADEVITLQPAGGNLQEVQHERA